MKISLFALRRYIALPFDVQEVRALFDDIGLEVKRVQSISLNGIEDVVIDIEILANRGDHYCYAGIAREVHARTGAALTLPESANIEYGSSIKVELQTDLCLRYTATLLRLEDIPTQLPNHIRLPLDAAEIHDALPHIDVTNLVNIEFGQPTHLFDADKIIGGITVRISVNGEKALPLFSDQPIVLPEGTIVIADDEKILAIAGVIGCEESKVTPTTRTVVLESALFDPISIRRTSRKLGIRTDSTVRFERGGDAKAVIDGAERAIWLLEANCNAKRVGHTYLSGTWLDPERVIKLDPQHTRDFLQINLSDDEIQIRLERYGFTVRREGSLFHVLVPAGRLWDVEFVSDLYEELAKSVSYSSIPTILPSVDMGSEPSEAEILKRQIDEVLVGMGFYEIFTDGFYGTDTVNKMGINEMHPLSTHVNVLNAVDKGYSMLKNNAFIQLIESISENLRMKAEDIKLFEWTRTFHKDESAENGLCTEQPVLAIICCGNARPSTWGDKSRPADIWFLKGILEELSITLKIPFRITTNSDYPHPLSDLLHPGRQAIIQVNNKAVGILGEAQPGICKLSGIKRSRPCYLEIEKSAFDVPPVRISYKDPQEQPPTIRNLAFTLPIGIKAESVIKVISERALEWLLEVTVTDLYEHEKDGIPVRTVTFELVWSNADRTRTANELNSANDILIAYVADKLGEKGVRLR